LIGLVQALKYETIPASLNCEQENDYINWKESPFFVNKANRPWHKKTGKSRTGAVSAFGMGGTNAHMVVEDYSLKDVVLGEASPYHLLVLSAKTQEALQEKTKDMIELLEGIEADGEVLSRISYTLSEGRQHFNYRCVVAAQDREEAIYALKRAWDKEKLPNLFHGKVNRGFKGQEALQQYAYDLLRQGRELKYDKDKYRGVVYALAELYCQGYEIDWGRLYVDSKPVKIHLPTYPFAKNRYWAEAVKKQKEADYIPGSAQFDNTLYEQLIDDVLNDSVSIDAAARSIRNYDIAVRRRRL
ncbi:MAG TPA: ketoacyl-synthetase C-terminal extension domain-containing protein, partial [Clostridia bacterium]|nr:ketoacyl-synthetase C-terminal extension domain-containing protein [Clostridia bacterium]